MNKTLQYKKAKFKLEKQDVSFKQEYPTEECFYLKAIKIIVKEELEDIFELKPKTKTDAEILKNLKEYFKLKAIEKIKRQNTEIYLKSINESLESLKINYQKSYTAKNNDETKEILKKYKRLKKELKAFE